MKPVTSSSPEIYLAIMGMQKHWLYASGDCYDMMLERTSKSVMLGMQANFMPGMPRMPNPNAVSRSAYPACQAGRAKTGNETSARREIWDQSLATILDKIKWNSKSPSPQIKDEGARRAKTRHFPILDLV